MADLKGKKLLVLGGKPIGSCEIVEYAKSIGVYTIAADYLPAEQSAAKRIADECWDISTAEVDTIVAKIKEEKIDGVYTGVNEFNIERMIEICDKAGLPCFCSKEQWDMLNNKCEFKKLCRAHEIPVAKEYHVAGKDCIADTDIAYPVIIKPVDGSGSRGFAVCRNSDDLYNAFDNAIMHSKSGTVLIEQKMNYENSVIVNYTIVNGRAIYCGMSDKHSKKVLEDGAPVMSVQFYPSEYEKEYLDTIDAKARNMFEDIGLKNGVLWIEAFCDKGSFTFNEMGYRFGGSLTYLPVKRLYGVPQLEMQVEYALTGTYSSEYAIETQGEKKTYVIFPIHVMPGIISEIDGIDKVSARKELIEIVYVHFLGDKIENWGSAQQVFAYVHYEVDELKEAEAFADFILNEVSVRDEKGNEMLFNLYR